MIQTEPTPNPESLKFLSENTISSIGTEEFQKSEINQIKNPFIKELLGFKGVELVLFSKNFLSVKKTKDRVFAIVQKILNYFRNPKYLIFSTYMTNFQEILVNIRINKSILLYKSPRPFHLTKYYNKGILRKKMFLDSSRSKKDKLKIFLDKEVIMNIPSSFLENYKSIGNDIKNIPFPKFKPGLDILKT